MLNIKNEVLIRVYLVAAMVVLMAFAIFGRLYQIGVLEAAEWRAKSDSLYVKWVDVYADRGNILADDGSLLATSLPFFDVHWDAKTKELSDEIFNESVDSLALLLSTHIDPQYTPDAYREWLIQLRNAPPETRGIRYVLIAKNLPYNKAMMVKKFPIFREGRHKGGFILEQTSRRERPFKMLAQRTIGYNRRTDALPVGLEGSFDNVLGGLVGKQLRIHVRDGIYIPVNDLAEIEPEAGADIVTTLDINIQDVAENALLRACQTHDADHGCAIVMEVKTGKIRAIANIGRTPEGWWETYNYAIGERVEPGSMFKLATFMAMLEDGYISDFDQKVPVYEGKVRIYNEELLDAVLHGRDTMTIKEVFAMSSNVGTATLTQQFYGNGRAVNFVKRLKDFGLDLPTDIEVGGEEAPFIKDPNDPKSDWSGTTLPWMSIGYEILLTPLQLLTFYNAVANEGRMMKPYLVQRTERYGEVLKEYRPTVVKRSVASKTTIAKAKELLKAVAQKGGTAENIQPRHYSIAGKTGTAQLDYHKFKTAEGISHQASFCGFFPADNPVYSCIVVISEPKGARYHGAEVAAPVFRQIADKCFALKPELHEPLNTKSPQLLKTNQLPSFDAGTTSDLTKSLEWLGIDFYQDEEDAENPPEWGVLIAERGDSLVVQQRTISDKTVPSVIGMGLKDAIYLLENRGCKVRAVGAGKVRQQSLAVGTRASGQTCVLYLE
jgi:cell division protein FtsI (penicillin-binding protein 3)